ncbi:MAG TPA: PHP domain-containing protein [Firmicutes bacterium]|nr:PHP domain-containing protein [Bacillota bacterium]
MKPFADYHTHTIYSHGTGTVEDNVVAAIKAGLEEVAITDHGPGNIFNIGVKGIEAFEDIRRDVEACNAKYPNIKVLLGVEANITGLDGSLDVPDSILQGLDKVLAGHHLLVRGKTPRDTWGIVGRNVVVRLCPRRLQHLCADLARRARVANTDALVRAVTAHRVDIVTHPGLMVSIDTKELARACALAGTALEINVKHAMESLDFVMVAAGEGVKFALSSDAHRPEDVGRLEPALEIARRAGLGPDMILNVR